MLFKILADFLGLFFSILNLPEDEMERRPNAKIILVLGGLVCLVLAGLGIAGLVMIYKIWTFVASIPYMSQMTLMNLIATFLVIAVPIGALNWMTGGYLGKAIGGFFKIFLIGGKKKKK